MAMSWSNFQLSNNREVWMITSANLNDSRWRCRVFQMNNILGIFHPWTPIEYPRKGEKHEGVGSSFSFQIVESDTSRIKGGARTKTSLE